jgi:hypothetical protein
MEDQLGAPGLVINWVTSWNTVYPDAIRPRDELLTVDCCTSSSDVRRTTRGAPALDHRLSP